MSAMVARLGAGPIDPVPVDVTNATSQWLYNDDKLLFTISDWSYEVHAAAWNISPYPAHATFDLLSLPQAGSGDFAAWWEAPDGSVIAESSATLSWLHGRYQSSGYSGPVSVLFGSMDLPEGSDPALLVIKNLGAPVQIGLSPYTLAQDLSVSFSDDGLGVSGIVTNVQYLDPPVPEPDSRWILVVAGAGLFFVPLLVNRIRGRHIQ